MSIVVIKGPPKSGKSLIANALRNNQIAFRNGALLVDEDQEGDARHLIEKLLVGAPVPENPVADISELPWKPRCMVIVVGAKEAILDEFEALVPGFSEAMGPIYTINTGVQAGVGDE